LHYSDRILGLQGRQLLLDSPSQSESLPRSLSDYTRVIC
jgi:hypothetical protein